MNPLPRSRFWLPTVLLALSACSEVPTSIPDGTANFSRASGAPAPSPLVPVTAGGVTQRIWPFTGTDLTGTPQDPINLVFIGEADARNVRNALLSVDGNRGGTPFAAFDCTWKDAIGGQQTAYAEQAGWSGSVIQLECGDYVPFRFHIRLFPAGEWTIANAHVDVIIPGTVDHQVLSWDLGEQFVTFDLARSGYLTGISETGPITPAPTFRHIPPVIFNALPAGLRALTGGPPMGDVADPVGIPNDGTATILALRQAPQAPGTSQEVEIQFAQFIPMPFCAASGEIVRVDGPVHLRQRVQVSGSGVLNSQTFVEGDLTVRSVGASGLGEPRDARVRDHYHTHMNGRNYSVFSERQQRLMQPAGPPQMLHQQLHVNAQGLARFRSDEKCR